MGNQETSIYEWGTAPVSLETAVSRESLLQMLDLSETRLAEALEVVTTEAPAEIVGDLEEQFIGNKSAGLHWHETYHVGQLEILRQVSGERKAFP